ncbi:MAG: prepilin-type N-terminal cleavage/methylation domain-containing protein [Synergistaceae bacterium]|nr:prepilin-type N-terminal cleavage/methylation domain-containing protein [Synergistaceae bacterium]
MAKCSKGFTLTELLTALVIHSFFILILGGTFYTLISFGSRSQMTMTARERGQRVINYIDSRVRNTGLGMWACENSSAIKNALAPLTASGRVFSRSDTMFPVMITNYANMEDIEGTLTKKSDLTSKTEDEKIICGNVLRLLYAQRETGTDSDSAKLVVQQNGIVVDYSSNADTVLETLINQLDDDDFWKGFFTKRCPNVFYNGAGIPKTENSLSVYEDYYRKEKNYEVVKSASETLKRYNPDSGKQIEAIAGYKEVIKFFPNYPLQYKFLYNRSSGSEGEFYYSDFGEKKKNNNSVEKYNIRAWGVSRGAGVPFVVDKYYDVANSKVIKELVTATPNDTIYTIPDGDELLYLKCVRVFAEAPRPNDPDKEKNLKVQKLNDITWKSSKCKVNPYQSGILEIYAELDTTKNILSVWVLSSGGKDNMTHERPGDWPKTAYPIDAEGTDTEWNKSDYKYHVLYVSTGTWKLNNLNKNSKWE